MFQLNGVKINQIDLAFAKEYLKVDYEDEDRMLESIILGAYSYVETYLGYKITDKWRNYQDIPDELTIACLLIISHWFDNRQMQSAGTMGNEIKFAVTNILEAHKIQLKDHEDDLL